MFKGIQNNGLVYGRTNDFSILFYKRIGLLNMSGSYFTPKIKRGNVKKKKKSKTWMIIVDRLKDKWVQVYVKLRFCTWSSGCSSEKFRMFPVGFRAMYGMGGTWPVAPWPLRWWWSRLTFLCHWRRPSFLWTIETNRKAWSKGRRFKWKWWIQVQFLWWLSEFALCWHFFF